MAEEVDEDAYEGGDEKKTSSFLLKTFNVRPCSNIPIVRLL